MPTPSNPVSLRHQDVRRVTLSDWVYAQIRRSILEMELEPGARLNIDAIATSLQASQTPVREALRRLAAEDLVREQPYKGFTVEPLLDLDTLADLLETRLVLEVHASRLAAGRISSDGLAVLQEHVDRMDEVIQGASVRGGEFNNLDAAFHLEIVAASGNHILARAHASLNAHVRVARSFGARALEHAAKANPEHRELLNALRDGDGRRAASLTRQHILSTLKNLKAHNKGS
jgi:DNA-binding GntR family transcriptional regulator